MALYTASATSATPNNIDIAYAGLWNLSTTAVLRVREIGVSLDPGAPVASVALKLLSARGTQTATVLGTPIDPNDVAGANGTLDSAYSVQPTVTGRYLRRMMTISSPGAGGFWQWWSGPGLRVGPLAGLAAVSAIAQTASGFEIYIIWEGG